MKTIKQAIAMQLAVLALTFSALAQAEGEKMMVLTFEGPKKQQIRDRVEAALKKAGYTMVPEKAAKSTRNEAALASAGKSLELLVFVDASIVMTSNKWEMTVEILSGSSGAIVDGFSIKAPWLPGLLKEIDKTLPQRVADVLSKMPQAKAAEAEAAVDEEAAVSGGAEGDDEEDANDEGDDFERRLSPLYAGLRLGGVLRNFTPEDSLFQQVLGQRDLGMPSGRVTAGFYPGAFFTGGTLGDFGIIGSYEQAFGAKTNLPADQVPSGESATRDISASDYWLSLHYRLHAGKHQLGFGIGTGSQKVDADIEPSRFIPDVKYNYLRMGVDALFHVGKFDVGLLAAYRPVSSLGDEPGQVAGPDWFPNAEADGMELGAHLGYDLTERLVLMGAIDYRRYGFDFHRVPADQMMNPNAPIAGGATDTFFGVWAGITYVIPGKR